ncbi:hypothetical protein [Ilumatobacter sp.]|uniref:hypothetical protein n=1 Tax=Ilumatobacter sp. TaxID=1967498 RepID=UPI003B529FEF
MSDPSPASESPSTSLPRFGFRSSVSTIDRTPPGPDPSDDPSADHRDDAGSGDGGTDQRDRDRDREPSAGESSARATAATASVPDVPTLPSFVTGTGPAIPPIDDPRPHVHDEPGGHDGPGGVPTASVAADASAAARSSAVDAPTVGPATSAIDHDALAQAIRLSIPSAEAPTPEPSVEPDGAPSVPGVGSGAPDAVSSATTTRSTAPTVSTSPGTAPPADPPTAAVPPPPPRRPAPPGAPTTGAAAPVAPSEASAPRAGDETAPDASVTPADAAAPVAAAVHDATRSTPSLPDPSLVAAAPSPAAPAASSYTSFETTASDERAQESGGGLVAALGSIVRTLVVAIVVALVVVAGRIGWERYESFESGAVAELPDATVRPPAGRHLAVRLGGDVDPNVPGATGTTVTVTADLATGDAVATSTDGSAYRSGPGGVEHRADAGAGWVPVTPEQLAADGAVVGFLRRPSALTITDVLPAETHRHLTVVSDSVESIPGRPLGVPGESVLPVSSGGTVAPSPTPTPTPADVATPPAPGAGADGSVPSTVAVRHLVVILDVAAMRTSRDGAAVAAGWAGDETGTTQIELWVDASGALRRMVTTGDPFGVGDRYELVGIGDDPAALLAGPVAAATPPSTAGGADGAADAIDPAAAETTGADG